MDRLKRLRKRLNDKIAKRRVKGRKAPAATARLKAVNAKMRDLAAAAARRRIDWNGHAPISNRKARKAARWVLAQGFGVYISSTTGGVHSAGSYHYQSRAFDLGSDDPTNRAEAKATEALVEHFGRAYFLELFGPVPWYIKNGQRYGGTFPNHDDHGHVAC